MGLKFNIVGQKKSKLCDKSSEFEDKKFKENNLNYYLKS